MILYIQIKEQGIKEKKNERITFNVRKAENIISYKIVRFF